MPRDFRVNVSAFYNIKLRKLQKRFGDDGLLSLVTLWAYAAEHKPDGLLGILDHDDIEMVADWNGERGGFVKALEEFRLLDRDEVHGYSVHDWTTHNPYLTTGSGKQGANVIDVRVAVGFVRHEKIRELRKDLGAEGVISLIRLWAFAAQHRTNGVLTNMTEEDIGAAAAWPHADDCEFVRKLVRLGLLDASSWVKKTVFHSDGIPPWEERDEEEPTPIGPFAIHDWKDWNPWRCGAEERSAKAKRAAKARHGAADTPASLHSMPAPPHPIKQASVQPVTSGATQASNPVVENSSGRYSEPASAGGLVLGDSLRR